MGGEREGGSEEEVGVEYREGVTHAGTWGVRVE